MSTRSRSLLAVLAIALTTCFVVAQNSGRNTPPRGNAATAGHHDDEAFEEHMSAAGGALRRLGRAEFKPGDRKRDLGFVSALQGAVVGAKHELESVPMAEAGRAKYGNDEAAYRKAFRLKLMSALKETLTLERAVLDGDAGAARASVKKLVGIRNSGHDLFQPEEEDDH